MSWGRDDDSDDGKGGGQDAEGGMLARLYLDPSTLALATGRRQQRRQTTEAALARYLPLVNEIGDLFVLAVSLGYRALVFRAPSSTIADRCVERLNACRLRSPGFLHQRQIEGRCVCQELWTSDPSFWWTDTAIFATPPFAILPHPVIRPSSSYDERTCRWLRTAALVHAVLFTELRRRATDAVAEGARLSRPLAALIWGYLVSYTETDDEAFATWHAEDLLRNDKAFDKLCDTGRFSSADWCS